MCNFFSVTSDGLGNIKYFNWEQRQQILSGELDYNPDSHTSINDYYGYKGAEEDSRNKYEYNPLTGKFTVDMINGLNDSKEVEKKVRGLDFKTICEPLIIKPIVNPFKIENNGVQDKHIELLKEWGEVRDEVGYSIGNSVLGSVWDLIGDSVRCSVYNSVYDLVSDSVLGSVEELIRGSVRNKVRPVVYDLVYAYISSFFNLEQWKYINHVPYKNPFQCAIDLWEDGFVPSFDGKVWRLHSGGNAEVVYEVNGDELMKRGIPEEAKR